MANQQEPMSPYNLENDTKSSASSSNNLAIAIGGSLVITILLWFTVGWYMALFVFLCCALAILYHLATTSEMSPFRIYYLIQEAKHTVIQEPRLYTQDDMAALDSITLSTGRDWASASGAFVELDGGSDSGGTTKETQLVFSTPVSRPVGRFWSKPKSLLWTITGYGSDFAVQEGLISETGKSYWVEKHLESQVLRLVQGSWNYETHEFADGNYVDSNGTMGSYPTLVKQK